jgi:hypothetical protein
VFLTAMTAVRQRLERNVAHLQPSKPWFDKTWRPGEIREGELRVRPCGCDLLWRETNTLLSVKCSIKPIEPSAFLLCPRIVRLFRYPPPSESSRRQ